MKRTVTIINEEGNSEKYEVFCTFDSEMTGKSYVIYTGYYEDDNGQLLVHAGSYEKIGEDTLRVNRNLTHEEHEMISTIMNDLIKGAKESLEKEKKDSENN